jgi:beta-glucosidase
VPIFNQSDRAPYALHVAAEANNWVSEKVGPDLNATLSLPLKRPAIQVQTTQISTQQDAKLVHWLGGAAKFFARSSRPADLSFYARRGALLQFDMVILQAPLGRVSLAMECGDACRSEVELGPMLSNWAVNSRHKIKIPLACFALKAADFASVNVPFSVLTSQPFAAAFANIEIVSDSARDADDSTCPDVGAGSN